LAIFAFPSKTIKLNNTNNIKGVSGLLSGFLESGRSFTVYRLPCDESVHIFQIGKVDLFEVNEFNPPDFDGAFIMSPFDFSRKAVALWPENKEVIVPYIYNKTKVQESRHNPFQLPDEKRTVREAYSDSFAIIKDALDDGIADKVVLARCLRVTDLPKNILPEVFVQLCVAYPNAFVFFVDHPKTGRWMGATPEAFLEKKGDQLRTVALAATRNRIDHSEDWTLKELEEQGLVSAFVDEILQYYDITDYQKNGPEPVRAGAMVHLRTSYKFSAGNLKNSIGQFLKSLHPTPAVGGYPQKNAFDVIQKAEHFNRGFYSGFLGPVRSGDFRFFVNIRSMELSEDSAVLYLGGGITRHSQEENEWEETRLKARTLLSVLHSVKQKYSNESIHL
jgi:isochorismate synthase